MYFPQPFYFYLRSSSPRGNYRPVGLTSVVGKMLESIVKEEIAGHLEKNGSIKQTQHGFMKGKSCLTNLLEFFLGYNECG